MTIMNKRKELYSKTGAFLQYPNLSLIGYMSVDVNRQYISDLSQLKFLNSSSNRRVTLDLNHNIEAAVKRTTDDNEEKIELLLKFLLDKRNIFKVEHTSPDFITYRRTLISIMCCPFGAESVYVVASYFKGSIYLYLMESPKQYERRQCRSEQEQKFCAWGYKFEQYLLSDSPNSEPHYDAPVVENEEFSLYYHAIMGGFKVIYGAQIDGLLTCNSTTDIPKSSNFEINVNYLEKNSFAELKTNKEIQKFRQERTFKKYKLLRCWCQCYLAGLKGLFVGFRSDNGIVHRLEWFETEKIPEICKNEWNPKTILEFLHHSLSGIKECFNPYLNEKGPISLKLEICSNKDIKIIDQCAKDEILPNWYTMCTN